MKTVKSFALALVVSLGLVVPARAGSHQLGGGGGGGGHASFAAARGGGAGAYHGQSARFATGRRFSTAAYRFGNSSAYRSRATNATNAHVLARHSANWQRNWSRNSDHWWHGHRCCWVNGSWVVFDLGFYPWYGYPYYYPWGYYGYDPGVYEGAYYGDQDYYNSSDQGTGSLVGTVQQRLANEGYYHGETDGVFGPMTRRALLRFQRDHGLRASGQLTQATLATMGLSRGLAND